MKTCPKCGRKFNWWQTVVGEYREHMKACKFQENPEHKKYMSMNCRGCTAECFKDTDYSK
jgi:hypothetical protein